MYDEKIIYLNFLNSYKNKLQFFLKCICNDIYYIQYISENKITCDFLNYTFDTKNIFPNISLETDIKKIFNDIKNGFFFVYYDLLDNYMKDIHTLQCNNNIEIIYIIDYIKYIYIKYETILKLLNLLDDDNELERLNYLQHEDYVYKITNIKLNSNDDYYNFKYLYIIKHVLDSYKKYINITKNELKIINLNDKRSYSIIITLLKYKFYLTYKETLFYITSVFLKELFFLNKNRGTFDIYKKDFIYMLCGFYTNKEMVSVLPVKFLYTEEIFNNDHIFRDINIKDFLLKFYQHYFDKNKLHINFSMALINNFIIKTLLPLHYIHNEKVITGFDLKEDKSILFNLNKIDFLNYPII